jgi:Glycosyltransferase 61/Methyltransferase domain
MGKRAMTRKFTLDMVTDAIVVPPPPRIPATRELQLAVLDRDGNPLAAAICGTNRLTSAGFAPSRDQASSPKHLAGRWLFGGLASHHFGHQITRSLGRLSGLAIAGKIDGIVFAPLDSRARDPAAFKMLTRLLAGFGISVPLRLLMEPTRIDTLLVGPDLFSEQTLCMADPGYVSWARAAFLPPDLRPIPGSKLYVTRSKLDPSLGRLLNEDVLEQNLADQGFQIYVPEVQSLPDQLKTYATAETIVTTDGSQGHVMAFARQSGQKIITIARRFDPPQSLLNHLDSFGHGLSGTSHIYVAALAREWWPAKRTDNLSLGECDFAALRDHLVRLGAVPANANRTWRTPDESQIIASKALGRLPADRLLSTAERAIFLSDLRQNRKPKTAPDPARSEPPSSKPTADAPITNEAEKPMDSAVTDMPASTHRADGMRYFRVLKGLHQRLKPDWYLEIGTFTGSSLRFVDCSYVAIDPQFQLEQLPPIKGRETIFFQDTSDAFFDSVTAKNMTGKINLAFLDGLHHYEALLRDFMNVEPLMAPGGMVILHDCLPHTVPMADRIQPPNTEWTGDVWKTLLILMAERPDLQIDVLDAAPTGLVVIRKMDAAKGKKLKSRYKALIKTWDPVTLDSYPGGLPGFWDQLTVLPAGPFVDNLPQS